MPGGAAGNAVPGLLHARRDDTGARAYAGRVAVSCALCGTSVEELPLTWMTSSERGRTVYYCDVCSREHLRSIEGKLDAEYW